MRLARANELVQWFVNVVDEFKELMRSVPTAYSLTEAIFVKFGTIF